MDRFQQYGEHEHSRSSWIAQMTRVYGWMFLGLVVTAVVALVVPSTPLLYLITNRFSLILLFLAEMGMVWFLSAKAMDMEYGSAAMAFIIYSALNGITFSLIFLAFTGESIAFTFFITSAFFGVMSVYGMATKKDLTSIGSMLLMGLIGVLIASLVNIFLKSTILYWAISYIGVAVFLGLTAYDTQKIKSYHAAYEGTNKENNVAIVGALSLYLDFINLFLYILRILGRRR